MEFDSKILKYLKLDKLIENLVGYAETQVAILRLEVDEKLHELTKSFIHFGIIAIFAMLFLLMFSMGLANVINEKLESSFWGFIIISFFYLILALILLTDKNKKIVSKWFSNNDIDGSENEK